MAETENLNNKKEYIRDGCILLARHILSSEIWYKPAYYFKIFSYILMKVNHEDNQMFERGSNYFNFSAERIPGVRLIEIYRFLKWARSEQVKIIATQKTTRGIIIKVNNYNIYQDIKNYKMSDRMTDKSQTEKRQESDKDYSINNNEELKINNITTTSTTEEKFLKENSDFKFLGEYHNVGLTEKQIRKLECMILNRKKLDQYIEELSENIAEKKEKNFDFEYPNMHEVRIKKYWLKDKNGRKTTQTTQNKPFSEMTDDEKKKYLKNKKSKGENLTPEEKEYYADITYGD